MERFKDVLHRCYKCQYCRTTGPVLFYDGCPSYVKFGYETFTGGGRVWVARGLFEGELELSESIVNVLFACPTCGNCSNQCIYPIRDNILQIIEGG